VRNKSSHLKSHAAIAAFPKSLRTEISLIIYKDLLTGVALFARGDTSFNKAVAAVLKPKLFM
jgi:hypothetical protein